MTDLSREPRTLGPFVQALVSTARGSIEALLRSATGSLDAETTDAIIARWCGEIFRAGSCTVIVEGQENVEAGRAYVVMGNHSSHLDLPAAFTAMPGRMRAIGKSELARVPVWGQAMRKMGFVFIDRDNRARAIEQLETAKQRFAEGLSVFIAPEGTRSRDGTLQPFKKGGFYLATQLGAPVLPMWIEGTREIMPPKTFWTRKNGVIRVRIGAPIPTDGLDVPALMDRVRAAFIALRDRN